MAQNEPGMDVKAGHARPRRISFPPPMVSADRTVAVLPFLAGPDSSAMTGAVVAFGWLTIWIRFRKEHHM